MSPILLGLAVMCCRVRQRPVSRANPRSPRQRSERWQGVAGAGIDVEVPPVGGLLDRDVDADAGAVVAGVGQGGQAGGGGAVEGGQGVDAGGGDVVHRAGLGVGDPQREPVRGETAWMLPPWAWALPEYHRSMTSPLTLSGLLAGTGRRG